MVSSARSAKLAISPLSHRAFPVRCRARSCRPETSPNPPVSEKEKVRCSKTRRLFVRLKFLMKSKSFHPRLCSQHGEDKQESHHELTHQSAPITIGLLEPFGERPVPAEFVPGGRQAVWRQHQRWNFQWKQTLRRHGLRWLTPDTQKLWLGVRAREQEASAS